MCAATRLILMYLTSLIALSIIQCSAQQQRQWRQHRWSKSATTASSFIPPAAPRVIKSSSSPSHSPTQTLALIATGYGTFDSKRKAASVGSTTALFAKKKKAGGSKSTKVQVKLLKHIAGTGQAGDVVLVSPAFFQNKLRPSQSAKLVSDEEVAKEKSEKKAINDANIKAATSLRDEISDFEFEIKRKAGPEGQLFGGVSSKNIIDELRKSISGSKNKEFLQKQSRSIKIASIIDDEGNKLSNDIKHVGKFDVSMALPYDINAEFTVTIVTE